MSPDSIAFDRAADYYDDTRGFPPGQEDAIARLFCEAGNLGPESCLLEIGVGTGRIALPLARHVANITGVDLARPMLERLRAKQGDEPIYLIQGDITQLPLKGGAFDAAAAVHVFHLVAGWRQVLAEVARVLRPGGVLLHGWNDDPRREDARDLLSVAWNAATHEHTPPNIGVARSRYRTFLSEEGWRRVGETLTHTYTATSTAAEFVWRLEQRTWSNMWRLPDDVVARGLAAVRAVIDGQGIAPDAPVERERTFNVEAYLPPAGEGKSSSGG